MPRSDKDIRDDDQGEHCWENLSGKRLYGYADGVPVNIRKEGWKECKLLRYECDGRMDYKRLLEQGYRIDSGSIESSCKNVVQGRLKGSGMRWNRRGASAMLEVRCALMSDLWQDVIEKCA